MFYTGEVERLIILVVIILGAKVFVTIERSVLLEEADKVFQVFLLVPFEGKHPVNTVLI